MTPYARMAQRQTARREAENAAWGDRRLVGQAARERMRAALFVDISGPRLAEIVEAMTRVAKSFLPRRRK